jgi:hypothetical protein
MSRALRLLLATLLMSTPVVVAVARAAVTPGHTPDAIAPGVSITSVTVDPMLRIVVVSFRPAPSSRTASAYQCSVKPSGTTPAYAPCRSPSVYAQLTPGLYTVEVRAAAGGVHYAATSQSVSVPIQFSRCWGAASRDPQHPCSNPALGGTVVPTPGHVDIAGDAYCRDGVFPSPGEEQCTFGLDPSPGRERVALIGDSHGTAMGQAMNFAAAAEGWSGVALIHNGCGFSDAFESDRGQGVAPSCYGWGQSVIHYLDAHPGVRAVFITGNDSWRYASSPPVGFERIWHQLPPSVRDIYIIRDVPRALQGDPDCVDNAIADHLPAIGSRCAAPRKVVLQFDAEAQAAEVSSSPRVHVIDLTPFFCGSARCFPVIGGVLVLTDLEHMTPDFSATLGPYLVRAVTPLSARIFARRSGAHSSG